MKSASEKYEAKYMHKAFKPELVGEAFCCCTTYTFPSIFSTCTDTISSFSAQITSEMIGGMSVQQPETSENLKSSIAAAIRFPVLSEEQYPRLIFSTERRRCVQQNQRSA
jgi:hypothetical protein